MNQSNINLFIHLVENFCNFYFKYSGSPSNTCFKFLNSFDSENISNILFAPLHIQYFKFSSTPSNNYSRFLHISKFESIKSNFVASFSIQYFKFSGTPSNNYTINKAFLNPEICEKQIKIFKIVI
jgi:hypothetical protein